MLKYSRVLLALIGAAVMLGALVGSASARSFSVTSQNIRAAWRAMTFTPENGETPTVCEVTLEGSLHSRTIVKVLRSLMGYITRADLGPCVAPGTATILRETLPWHIQYDGFTGTLPTISSIRARIIGASFRIGGPIACLARSTTTEPVTGTFNRNTTTGALTSIIVGGTITTNCFIRGTLSGTSNPPTLLNAAGGITVTLI